MPLSVPTDACASRAWLQQSSMMRVLGAHMHRCAVGKSMRDHVYAVLTCTFANTHEQAQAQNMRQHASPRAGECERAHVCHCTCTWAAAGARVYTHEPQPRRPLREPAKGSVHTARQGRARTAAGRRRPGPRSSQCGTAQQRGGRRRSCPGARREGGARARSRGH